MTEASILPKKIGKQPPGRERSVFSPDMLDEFRERIAAELSDLFDAKTSAALDSVGLKPLSEAIDEAIQPLTAGVLTLNGMPKAAFVQLDPALVHHSVDLMLGGSPDENDPPAERAASSLDDRFCKQVIARIVSAFGACCEKMVGSGVFSSGECSLITHDVASLAIASRRAEALTVRITVEIGHGGRQGLLEFGVPLSTLDTLFGNSKSDIRQDHSEDDPWFAHMKASVLDMGLEMLGAAHTIEMSVAELSRLDVGQVIPLPAEMVGDVPLVLEDGGDVIASGQLGASAGQRAIRLAAPPDSQFLEPLVQLLNSSRSHAA